MSMALTSFGVNKFISDASQAVGIEPPAVAFVARAVSPSTRSRDQSKCNGLMLLLMAYVGLVAVSQCRIL